jgi:hypothetical protein
MKNTAGLSAIPEKDGSDLSRRHYLLIISLEKNSTTLFSDFLAGFISASSIWEVPDRKSVV